MALIGGVLGAAGALMVVGLSGGGSSASAYAEAAQDSSAVDSGIRIRLVSARFAGTATLVSAIVRREDGPTTPGEATIVALTHDGFQDGPIAVNSDGAGRVQLRLPAIDAAQPEHRVHVTEVGLYGVDGPERIAGRWELILQLPAADVLAAALRTEEQPFAAQASGGTVAGTAVRSAAEVVLIYEVPDSWEEVDGPATWRDGQLARFQVLHHGGLNYAVATRLPGEDELRVVLGAYQAPREGSGGGTVEILLPAAANGTVEVAAEGRLADRLTLTAIRLDAEQGWAELVFDGSMPPRMADLRVLGASGDVLPILTETVQYAKGADG